MLEGTHTQMAQCTKASTKRHLGRAESKDIESDKTMSRLSGFRLAAQDMKDGKGRLICDGIGTLAEVGDAKTCQNHHDFLIFCGCAVIGPKC